MPLPLIKMKNKESGKTCMAEAFQVPIMKKDGWTVTKQEKSEEEKKDDGGGGGVPTMDTVKEFLSEKGVQYHPSTKDNKLRELYAKVKSE